MLFRSFNNTFSIPAIQAPLNTENDFVTFDIYVDSSSIEVFSENGAMAMTAIVFPGSIYDIVDSGNSTDVKVRNLKRIH